MLKFLISLTVLSLPFLFTAQQEIQWKAISPQLFEQAKKENKIILLNLEANWCHWCHVMHDSTYSNPKVIAYLAANFITVKADQDANPELAVRYKDYGWPATIFLNADGEDVVKRRGYIAPERFLSLIKSIVADPSPEITDDKKTTNNNDFENTSTFISSLEQQFRSSLDYDKGGFNQSQKFIENDTYEYAVFGSTDPLVKKWILKSIAGAKQLSDPAWGGIYQYSTHNDWKHLHYEKLLSIQARYIRLFVLNYLYNDDNSSLAYAEKCVDYINRFLLSDNGYYFNAQDADLTAGEHADFYFKLSDEERLKLGIPKVDQNTYTHNNAEIAQSLLVLYQATTNEKYLASASNILKLLISNRKSKNGLFQHSDKESTIVSLRDNLAVADALIQYVKFYPNDAVYTSELASLLATINTNFLLPNGSFKSFSGNNGLTPSPIVGENIRLSRLMNWYGQTYDTPEYIAIAKNCFSFLSQSGLVDVNYSEPAMLMLNQELKAGPLEHVFMINGNDDKEMESKMKSLAPFYSNFRIAEKINLPVEKQEYFESFEQNVLLICTNTACSVPMFTSSDVQQEMKRMFHFQK
ncbi:MAG: DUF255 domain-containing protein [Bacteroidota bacterium]